MKRGHLRGIKYRFRIFNALFTQSTDGLKKELVAFLDDIGHVYSGVCANLNPLSFLERTTPHYNLADASELDFSSLNKHDFLSAAGNLPQEWISEIEVSDFIGRLAYMMGVRTVIEVGCFVGVTTSYIAKALTTLGGNRRLYSIDIEKKYLDITTSNLKSLGLLDNFYPILNNSLSADVINDISKVADLVFIDSSHQHEETIREILMYSEKLSPNGCLVLHDSIQWPGVREAVSHVSKSFDLMTFATSRGNGLTVIIKKEINKNIII